MKLISFEDLYLTFVICEKEIDVDLLKYQSTHLSKLDDIADAYRRFKNDIGNPFNPFKVSKFPFLEELFPRIAHR